MSRVRPFALAGLLAATALLAHAQTATISPTPLPAPAPLDLYRGTGKVSSGYATVDACAAAARLDALSRKLSANYTCRGSTGFRVTFAAAPPIEPPPPPPPPPPAGGDVAIATQGAKCDGKTDDAGAIRAALALAKTRGTYATIPAATCAYGSVITLDGAKLKGLGDSSVLASLNPQATAFFLRGDGAEIRSVKIAGAYGPNRTAPWEQTRITLFGAKNFVIDNVTIEGSTAAGIQFAQSTGPGKVTNNRVRNTLSDSIHMTDKAHDILVEGNTVENSGDDGIAVVSYRSDGAISHHITARNNVIRGNKHGRGMSVVGGADVLYEFNQVENSGLYACMYLAQENSYSTFGVDRVIAQRNTLKNCGSTSTGHGAIMAFSDGGAPNSEIKLIRNDIVQQGQNGIRAYGPQTGLVIDSNRITGANPALQLPGGVTATPFTGGLVGHLGTVVVVQPPPVVVDPPVTPPTGLTFVNPLLVPAPIAGSSTRDIATTTRQPVKDGGGIGAFRTVCNRSHFLFDDPLVFPGQPGKSHLHMFFGNTGADGNSTVASVQGAGNGTCRGGIVNRSGYWVAATIDTDTGAPLEPGVDGVDQGGIDVYYKTGYHGVADAAIKPIPPGFRMITGDSKSRVYQDKGVEFACDGSNYGRSWRTCSPGQWLHIRYEFPQCWDGRNLSSPDNKSHVAWATDGRGCIDPAFPVPLPEVSYVTKFKVPAKGMSSWRLSSDAIGAPPFSSTHADYWFGWEGDVPGYEGIVPAAVKNIINRGLSGGSDLVGDGRTIFMK